MESLFLAINEDNSLKQLVTKAAANLTLHLLPCHCSSTSLRVLNRLTLLLVHTSQLNANFGRVISKNICELLGHEHNT